MCVMPNRLAQGRTVAVVLGWRFVLGRMRDVGLSLGVFLESGIGLNWIGIGF